MRLVACLSALFLSAGCATKHSGNYALPDAGTSGASSDMATEADALWAQRGDTAQLQAALDQYEQLVTADPTDRVATSRLVRGYYFMGDTHLSEKDAKLAAWDTAVKWGTQCLAINSEFSALLEKGDETEATATKALTVDDVPCTYWTASALGKWGKLSGLAKTLKHLPTVKAYITRVNELDPTFFHSGPDRYWGAYYAGIPSFAGRDLDKSRDHFDRSIQAAPNYLGTQVLLAEYWAVTNQDKATFTSTLQGVLEADPAAAPDIEPENRKEQIKAQALLDKTSDLFAE